MGENDQKTTFASVEQKVVIVTGAAQWHWRGDCADIRTKWNEGCVCRQR